MSWLVVFGPSYLLPILLLLMLVTVDWLQCKSGSRTKREAGHCS